MWAARSGGGYRQSVLGQHRFAAALSVVAFKLVGAARNVMPLRSDARGSSVSSRGRPCFFAMALYRRAVQPSARILTFWSHWISSESTNSLRSNEPVQAAAERR